MRTSSVTITTDASGAGTATTIAPISGELVDIRAGGAAFGTANITVTRATDGRVLYGKGISGTVFDFPRPVADGYLILTVKGGGNHTSDTVRILWED